LPNFGQVIAPEVDGFLAHYLSGPGRSTLEIGLARRSQYAPVMIKVLTENGLPPELVNLPFVESLYREDARSPSGAVGMWQFMGDTARQHGLRVGLFVDERKDVLLATKAASSYIRELYDMFDDWQLALGAYNCGAMRMREAIRQGGTRDFFELSRRGLLPKETQDFVPKIIAVSLIAQDPRSHGIDVTSSLAVGNSSRVPS
jgi:membrane-bound lytic murein transglycosylase D